jgi:GxxExxY protein
MCENEITAAVIDSALKIHRVLGPGLLESVYEEILAYELVRRGFLIERQKAIPLVYEDLVFADPFRADLIVDQLVLIELKSIESLQAVHAKQTLTYIRLAISVSDCSSTSTSPSSRMGSSASLTGCPNNHEKPASRNGSPLPCSAPLRLCANPIRKISMD